MKTLCLVMIVKNEAKIIERCLTRVKPYIDYWVIVDTGSTDNTMELIQQTLHNIPGELHQRPWKNFGHNRTESLKLAKNKADYLLLCDADEQLIFSPEFNKSTLDKDVYLISYQGSMDYSVPYLINNRLDCFYVGVTHEYLTYEQAVERHKINSISILDLKDGGSKENKYQRDIELLTQGLLDEPENSRYKFYLANSYRDIDDYQNAALWYHNRIKDGGWYEEVTCAYEYLGKCYALLKDNKNALYYWLEGYNYNPKRMECLYQAVRLLRVQEKYQLAYQLALIARQISYPQQDILFIQRDIYLYWLDYELSIIAYYTDNFKLAYECCKTVFKYCHNQKILNYTLHNLSLYHSVFAQDNLQNREWLAQRISQLGGGYKESSEELYSLSKQVISQLLSQS